MLNNEKDEMVKNVIKKIKVENYNSYEIDNFITIANKRKRTKRITSIATVVISILIICMTILLKFNFSSNDSGVKFNANNRDENLYNDTIILSDKNNNQYISDSFPEIIAIVKVDKILENKFEENEPVSLVKSKVIEIKSGEYFEETIEFYIEQCILDEITEDMKIKFNILNTQKIRIVKNEIVSKLEYPVVGNIYIVALKNVNNNLFVDTEYKYSFYKFDIENSLVNINGNWKKMEK